MPPVEPERTATPPVGRVGSSLPTVGLAWAGGAALLAGSFVVPWKLATPHGDESTAALLLLLSAAVSNSMVVPFGRGAGARWSGTALRLSLALAVLTLAGNLASAAAIERISAPLLSLLQRAEVLLVALIAWAAMGERPHRLFWVGGAVAATGLLWMSGGGGRIDSAGVVLGLVSAACFGSMLVAVRKWVHEVDPVFVNALRLWLAVAMWFVVHRRIPDPAAMSPNLVAYASLAGLLGPFGSRLFSMQSSRTIEARFTALILLSSPVFALPLSWLFLDALPSARELEGGALMLLGITIPVAGMLRRRSLELRTWRPSGK